jgi:hypothetical protein
MIDKSRDQHSGHPSSSTHNSYVVECGIYGVKGIEEGDPNFESSSKVNAAFGKEYVWTVSLINENALKSSSRPNSLHTSIFSYLIIMWKIKRIPKTPLSLTTIFPSLPTKCFIPF